MTVATKVPLFARALIEASAGNGKTWTLSGILLRLLLEEDGEKGIVPRPPQAIVATTFTRKAAAEMRHRLQQRINAFQALLRGIVVAYDHGALDLHDDARLGERLAQTLAAWRQGTEPGHAKAQGRRMPALDRAQISVRNQAAGDPINGHILLTSVRSGGLNGLIALLQRTEQRFVEVEELFIGTFDSLCQRWLGEYALETGSDSHRNIVDGSATIEALVHDRLRGLYLQRYRADPSGMATFAQNRRTVDDYVKAVKERLVFSDAPFDPVSVAPFDSDAYRKACAKMAAVDADAYLAALADKAFRALLKNQGNGRKFLELQQPRALWRALSQDAPLPEHESTGACAWADLMVTGKGFRTAQEVSDTVARWRAHPLNTLLAEVVALRSARDFQSKKEQQGFIASLVREVFESVRETLPQRLETQGETTFTEQIARLGRVLAGPNGAALARDIAYRYPVMLVDEAQDLNGAQTELLERVYLHRDGSRGFLLLVGDPKQAIYRFRGGDVRNYRRLKAQFPVENSYFLSTNFRSSAPLVVALNTLYAEAPPLGKDIVYTPVTAAVDGPRALVRANSTAPDTPLYWYEVADKDEEPAQVLAIVQALTAADSHYGMHGKDGRITRIRYSDILILMTRNARLETMQQLLQKNGIAAEFTAQSNVFAGRVAEALLYLFQAIATPEDRGIVNRLLATILFARTLCDIGAMERTASAAKPAADHELSYDVLATALYDAARDWRNEHLLSALQRLLARSLGGMSIWQRLAGYPAPQGARYLLDLRQLLQIIAAHSRTTRAQPLLRWWQHCLAEPPEADWAIVTPLPGKDAVRLMTIHKAKGLQAPVVIVAGLGGGRSPANKVAIHPYHDDNGLLRLSSMPLDEEQQAHVNQEELEEQARLLYVALTRAEDLLFVGVRGDNFKKNFRHPALLALAPERCFTARHHQLLPPDPVSIRRLLSQTQTHLPKADPATAHKQHSKTRYGKTHFYGWRKTSFSALTRDSLEKKERIDYSLPDFAIAADETGSHAIPTAQKQEHELPLPFSFPRGPNAGLFLHAVLERLDVHREGTWLPVLERCARRYQLLDEETPLAKETFAGYRRWLADVLDSFLVSKATLRKLPPAQRVNEMDFHLRVDTARALDINAFNRLFHDWGKPLRLCDARRVYGFIRGEIDVCYYHEGRYHVLDYKSNHLGDRRADYDVAAMTQAMDDHHYWLQALIYQTALHRFLKSRLPDYAPCQHLGTPEYIFLRGCQAHSDAGHLPVVIEPALVLAFDALLGGRQ